MFACAACRAWPLRRDGDALACPACGATAHVVDDVAVFVETDTFYDEYAEEHAQFHPNPGGNKERVLRWLPFWSWREWRFLRSSIPPDGVLVELGCGRGRELFATREGTTIGIEGAMAAARDCVAAYDAVALAHLPGIPLPDASADVVVSAHVIGHLGTDDKDELFSEIHRVLRPGGRTVHIIETDSEHPAVVAAKAKPDAYRDRFVDQHGHIGLEPTAVVLDRLERAGFHVTRTDLVEAVVLSAQNLHTFFNHPDLQDLPETRKARRFATAASRGGATNIAYEIAMGAFHRTVEQWAGKPERSQFVHVVADRER